LSGEDKRRERGSAILMIAEVSLLVGRQDALPSERSDEAELDHRKKNAKPIASI
jgi:hypothetical protein